MASKSNTNKAIRSSFVARNNVRQPTTGPRGCNECQSSPYMPHRADCPRTR